MRSHRPFRGRPHGVRPRWRRLAAAAALPLVALLALLLVGCAGDSQGPSTTHTTTGGLGSVDGATSTTVSSGPAPGKTPAGQNEIQVAAIATGLEVPWEVRWLPSGDMLVTERPGRLRLIGAGGGSSRLVASLPVAAVGEGGLLGLAIDPDYPDRPYLYVFYTRRAGGGLENRISRLTYRDGQAGDEKVLIDGIPGAGIHDGGRLAFGPDGYLWATTGDASVPSRAQDRSSLAGKVLRFDRDGRPAPGNPFPGSLVYTLGHRNPQGIDWLPGTEQAFITEHGPSDNDEINRLEAGGNYGWPDVRGKEQQAGYRDPLFTWTPTIAPSGAIFYTGTGLAGWQGSFLFTTLKGEALHRLVPADAGFDSVKEDVTLFEGSFGRLRDVRQGPDGALYLLTSNRDGRGDPGPDDDRILRLMPR